MVTTHIGCSGFNYKHWKGSFYPDKLAQKNWFNYYCEHFNTLELNVTFYRFPRIHNLQQWYRDSTSNLIYYRFHGNEQVYASNYTHEALKSFSDALVSNKDAEQAYVFFNNDINTHAIFNAKELKTILG